MINKFHDYISLTLVKFRQFVRLSEREIKMKDLVVDNIKCISLKQTIEKRIQLVQPTRCAKICTQV